MSHRLFGMLAVIIGIAFVPATARAATINTYSFTQGNWQNILGLPDSGLLQGTFTATVGSSGQIGLNAITQFSLRYTDHVFGEPLEISWPISGLSFFSYRADLYDTDPSHGATTLTLIANTPGGFRGCVGAAVALSPSCDGAFFPPNALAVLAGDIYYSTSAPVITLVSSVEVQNPAAIPEPATLILFGTGLCGVIRVSRPE